MVFFFKFCVLIPLNKMEQLKAKASYWNYLGTFCSYLPHHFLGEVVLTTYYFINRMPLMIPLCSFSTFPFIQSFSMYFWYHILYITSCMVKINFLLGLSNVSLWDIVILKMGIDVSLQILIGIVSIDVYCFDSILYYTPVPYNDDICSHFSITVSLPSSQPYDSTVTWDASLTSLHINIVHDLLKFHGTYLQQIMIQWRPCLILPRHYLLY